MVALFINDLLCTLLVAGCLVAIALGVNARCNFFFGGGGEQLFGTLGRASLICYTACKCPQSCNAKSVQHMCVGTAAWPLFVILVGLQIGTAAWPRWYYWPADWHCSLAPLVLLAGRLALQLGHCLFFIVGQQIGTAAWPLFVFIIGLQIGTAAWPCWYRWPADRHSSWAIVCYFCWPAEWHCGLAVLVLLACRFSVQLGHCCTII